MTDTAGTKKCFVVMGFGEKTDFQQQVTYDLDKTYRVIIKKAVEEAGLECIRADDVIHSGIIDKPMYELLLDADLVVADLSTSNANAIYELGVRHALRPYTTIVIAEKNFKFPFDIGHLLIRPYEHLGKGIDAEEAERVRDELKTAIVELIDKAQTDSPVYEFLHDLQGPVLKEELSFAVPVQAAAVGESSSLLMELFREARADANWPLAISTLKKLRARQPDDTYLIQQTAHATYKSRQPDPQTALASAREILSRLNPRLCNDPETLGIWGSIHKRLWELNGDRSDLDESLHSYGKGFHLKEDYYNGINYAFMLNVRAQISTRTSEIISDVVSARQVRRRVAEICEQQLHNYAHQSEQNPQDDPEWLEERFWLYATLAEALVGIDEFQRADAIKATAAQNAPEPWMMDTLEEQLVKLKALTEKATAWLARVDSFDLES